MSHVPQPPRQYVCTNCNSVYADADQSDRSTDSHNPPAECAACGGHEFAEIA